MSDTETSPDVCYRHPKRESWVLCQRCGRTICPECQILAPVGVQCPDCVREAGGSASWQRAGSSPRPARAVRARPEPAASGWQARLQELLRPGSSTPAVSWTLIGLVVVLWLASFALDNRPFLLLAAFPAAPLEIWRYATAPLAYPALLSFGIIFALVLNVVFFLLIAPAIERMLARPRYFVVLLSAGIVGSSAMVLSGGLGYGLSGVLFGFFGAYLVVMWSIPQARTQVLVMIAINVLISLVIGGYFLPQIVGGLIGGAGATFLMRYFENRPGAKASTPYTVIAAVVLGFVVLTIVRALAGG